MAAIDALPPLPQVEILKRMVAALLASSDVVAIWLGGSFAHGRADEHSDLDFRVAVTPEASGRLTSEEPSALIGEAVAGVRSNRWEGAVWHQLILESGVMLDLVIQSTDLEPPQDNTLVLACRGAAYAERLSQARLPPPEELAPASPEIIRQVIVDYWIDSHKHAKVLHRGLDLILLVGLGFEQPVLMRLWHADATGMDMGTQRPTIHTLTDTARTVMNASGEHAMETVGTPRRTRGEIVAAIEKNRDEVARVGHRLADRLGFDYPESIERTVRESWGRFLRSQLP